METFCDADIFILLRMSDPPSQLVREVEYRFGCDCSSKDLQKFYSNLLFNLRTLPVNSNFQCDAIKLLPQICRSSPIFFNRLQTLDPDSLAH